jgi:hypothetical protein
MPLFVKNTTGGAITLAAASPGAPPTVAAGQIRNVTGELKNNTLANWVALETQRLALLGGLVYYWTDGVQEYLTAGTTAYNGLKVTAMTVEIQENSNFRASEVVHSGPDAVAEYTHNLFVKAPITNPGYGDSLKLLAADGSSGAGAANTGDFRGGHSTVIGGDGGDGSAALSGRGGDVRAIGGTGGTGQTGAGAGGQAEVRGGTGGLMVDTAGTPSMGGGGETFIYGGSGADGTADIAGGPGGAVVVQGGSPGGDGGLGTNPGAGVSILGADSPSSIFAESALTGGPILIQAGDGGGAGAFGTSGGSVTISTGDGGSTPTTGRPAGNMALTGGIGGSSTVAGNADAGGSIAISGGHGGDQADTGAAGGPGGSIDLVAGHGGNYLSATKEGREGGSCSVVAGAGGAARDGGVVLVQAGLAGNSIPTRQGGDGGSVTIQARNGGTGSATQAAGAGGPVSIVAGNAASHLGGGSSTAGYVALTAGSGSPAVDAVPATPGGAILLIAGAGTATVGGALAAGTGGAISLQAATGGNGSATGVAGVGGAVTIQSGDAGIAAGAGGNDGGNITIECGLGTGAGVAGDILVGTAVADSVQLGRVAGNLAFFGNAAVVKQISGGDLTNSVTAGGTTDKIDDYGDLVVYANDAAAIRNDIYQLARKLKQVNDALRDYGLLT